MSEQLSAVSSSSHEGGVLRTGNVLLAMIFLLALPGYIFHIYPAYDRAVESHRLTVRETLRPVTDLFNTTSDVGRTVNPAVYLANLKEAASGIHEYELRFSDRISALGEDEQAFRKAKFDIADGISGLEANLRNGSDTSAAVLTLQRLQQKFQRWNSDSYDRWPIDKLVRVALPWSQIEQQRTGLGILIISSICIGLVLLAASLGQSKSQSSTK